MSLLFIYFNVVAVVSEINLLALLLETLFVCHDKATSKCLMLTKIRLGVQSRIVDILVTLIRNLKLLKPCKNKHLVFHVSPQRGFSITLHICLVF